MPTLHEEKGRGEERESTAGIKLSIASHGRQTQSSWENKQSLELCSFHLQAECKLSDLNCLHKPQTLIHIFAFFAHLKIRVEVCKVSSLNAKELADRGKVVHDIGKHLRTIHQ